MDNKMAFHEKQKGLCFCFVFTFNIFHMVEVKKIKFVKKQQTFVLILHILRASRPQPD